MLRPQRLPLINPIAEVVGAPSSLFSSEHNKNPAMHDAVKGRDHCGAASPSYASALACVMNQMEAFARNVCAVQLAVFTFQTRPAMASCPSPASPGTGTPSA
jgi:hypothetical protein